jgi:molybdenum cofactor cytidylyltransferase
LEAIVLAAGAGRRFGGRKLLAPFEGRPLILGALDAAFNAPARTIILAVADDAELRSVAMDHARRRDRIEDLRLMVAADAGEGLGGSLRNAASALPDDTEGVFVFLGDMPCIPPAAPLALARAFDGPGDLIAPRQEGRRGHPVLFGADWFPALRASSGDVGAQALLAEAGDRLRHVEGFSGVLFDVDRPADLDTPRS